MSQHARIRAVVRLIPAGAVASYGDVARCLRGVTPRHVGFALAAVGEEDATPWHRVVNARGEISPRPGEGPAAQKRLLGCEGVRFNAAGRIDWRKAGWRGPALSWFIDQGWTVEEALGVLARLAGNQ
ncbi:MAG: MGMT family protein [Pseudomonadota bacterium]